MRVHFFPIPSSAFVVVCFLDDGQSDWGDTEPWCSFNLHFIYGCDVEYFFMYLLAICIFLLRTVYSICLPIY
jgi:hypothetical protein